MPRIHRWTYFTWSNPGTEERVCRLCAAPATVRRNVAEPTSYAEALMKRDGRTLRRKDIFTCRHNDEAWHIKAGGLWRRLQELGQDGHAELLRTIVAGARADR